MSQETFLKNLDTERIPGACSANGTDASGILRTNPPQIDMFWGFSEVFSLTSRPQFLQPPKQFLHLGDIVFDTPKAPPQPKPSAAKKGTADHLQPLLFPSVAPSSPQRVGRLVCADLRTIKDSHQLQHLLGRLWPVGSAQQNKASAGAKSRSTPLVAMARASSRCERVGGLFCVHCVH